ncbi:MAG: thiosulfohydrolase SoxB [Candidatus Rokubacteria bacterium]|nr:thiosulfohydrolase SoxB [Candidatus Rokubacteria bacterium]
MEVTRRDLLKLLAIAAGAGMTPRRVAAAADAPARLLDFQPLGNVTLLHITDSHATLLPVHFREPDTLLGVGDERGKPPYLTGRAFLRAYNLAPNTPEAYAYTHVDFPALAARYGRMGGYAHLATLVKRVRAERPGRTLLLDGGDTLQGSATAVWSRGEDMLRATNRLGVEVFTAHWEFVYGIERVKELFGDRERKGLFAGDFVAQNVSEAGWGDPVFHPYTIREVGGVRLGVIGQAFPYTPISHPRRFVPDLTFGIKDDQIQKLVGELRDDKKVDAVVLLSHNGVAVDLKLATRVSGLDVVLGGHTHDGLPAPIVVGRTLVVNSGSHAKFLSRLDLDVRGRRVVAHRYRLIPVLSKHIPEDPDMSALIREIRGPHEAQLGERLAVSESLLYRRGNFNGPFDELILDALLKRGDAQVAFSPGFRWGVSIVPGQEVTLEDVYSHTALTYPNTWVRELTGREIHQIMEDVADNLFHPDPYYRQGGDMVRMGGLTYTIEPARPLGRRIRDIRVAGRPLDPARRYKATGWASIAEVDGPPAWDVVADHLRSLKRVKLDPRPRVRVVG